MTLTSQLTHFNTEQNHPCIFFNDQVTFCFSLTLKKSKAHYIYQLVTEPYPVQSHGLMDRLIVQIYFLAQPLEKKKSSNQII